MIISIIESRSNDRGNSYRVIMRISNDTRIRNEFKENTEMKIPIHKIDPKIISLRNHFKIILPFHKNIILLYKIGERRFLDINIYDISYHIKNRGSLS